ncbi:coiled-coil domain-containing protein 186-like isoform X2 [Mercenaria mercenaria]|uniref:coiled-coil domain-containing protein 186-like isoform X2 n=1 Tax=Mercenaria mercenaria TaxID=6596 RepID=UPI00234EBC49|nr:coiled-coil domain-containing protein 186-like isoform X2 [Mercenaria mercenaria]
MSDAEQEEDDTLENPDPEADSVAEASVNLNAEAESSTNLGEDSSHENAQVERNLQTERNSDNVNHGASASGGLVREGCDNHNVGTLDEVENDENLTESASENPEGFSLPEDQAEAEGQDNNSNFCNNSLTEGDQNRHRGQDFVAGNLGDNQNIEDECAEPGHGFQNINEYAAEDEQYFPVSCVGADASVSLQPERNVGFGGQNNGEAEGAVGASLEEEQNVTSHRTESCCQLDEYDSQQLGAGSYNEIEGDSETRNPMEACEADGASASGQDVSLEPESELEESRSHIILERDTEPTESDGEDEPEEHPDNAEGGDLNENQNAMNVVNESGAEGFDEANIENEEVGVEVSEHVTCDEKNVPEDEISVVAAEKPESYQPECDQSESKHLQAQASRGIVGANDGTLPNLGEINQIQNPVADASRDIECSAVINNETESQTDSRHSNSNALEVEDLDESPNNCDKNKPEDERAQQAAEAQNESFKAIEIDNFQAFTRESGAIPKNRTQRTNVPSHSRNLESKPSHEQCEVVNSEDELLSELDATLKSNSVETNVDSSSENCAMSRDEQIVKGDNPVSCDQCLRNNLRCSFKASHHEKGGNSNIPGLKELKKQLYQAKQMLLDRECEISRLKEDVSDHRTRCETLTSERDSNAKELDRLKMHNSDDLYIPQIKELEYTIAQQTNEIRGLKDKLSSHDGAAKRAIATLQHEMKIRVDQVTKQCEEATREKDTMVVKFAQAEHKNLEFQKQAERAENKLKEMEKERDVFLVRMRAVKEQRSKLAAEVEAKNAEMSHIQKELDKHKEMVSSADVRVKWAQNKLKVELETHKETKVQLEKMTVKLKEAKEETQQIRQDCQAIIKTYQESEEVKSNSLDKELKLKESELLAREVQKNNFELAHVKTQRELEQVRVELRESQSKFSALSDKLSNVEAEKEQINLTATKYEDIIQRQKKEVQELREKVESLVQFKTDFTSAQELIKNLDTEITELKMTNKELVSEMEACRRRETDKLELNAKLSRKNAELQSENTTLSNKVLNLTGELQAAKMENQDTETKLKDLADSLEKEQKLRQEESQSMNTKLAGKCKAVEDLTRKLEDEKDEIKTLKRKHANNIKDLTRQLQQVRRKLENYEANTNGDKDTISMGSRTSSNGSLNTISIAEQTTTQVVQPHAAGQQNSINRNPSPEQEYPVITEQVEVDKQTLIERIVKLQRALARKNEKIEFMEDHISQLVDEIQKKNRIIQSYILKEETGTMTSDYRDREKAEISRKHSIMGSVYSSHSNDGTMTLDLSLEINRKLQAVLEDTLLKNMTLKESLDTLGQEIARLSQENRRLQLLMQGKSRSKVNPSSR